MLKYYFIILLFSPALVLAETGSLQSLLVGIGGFMNSVVIPFILAIAFIVFVVNVVRFFVIGGASDEGQKNAKNLAIYGIGAFVFILSFWGIINMLISGVGLETKPCTNYTISDYIIRENAPCESPRPISRPEEELPEEEVDEPEDPSLIIKDALEEIITNIKSTLADSSSALEKLFGDLANDVNNDLFAEFITNAETIREEEAKAVVRAAMLKIITSAEEDAFFLAYQAEQIAEGLINTIDKEAIDAFLANALPSNIVTKVNDSKDTVKRQLDVYIARGTFVPPLTLPDKSDPATSAEIIDYLFDQATPAKIREEYLIELITNPYDVIDADLGDDIYNEYIDVNNVLTTYNARFDIIDKRDPDYTGPR